MRTPLEKIGRSLHYADHAGTNFPIVAACLGHQLMNRLPGRLRQLAQELSVMEEVGPNQLGNGEHPLRVADLLEDLLAKQRTKDGRPFRRTGGTEHAPATGEGNQVLRPTLVAIDPGKPTPEVAARLEGEHHAVDEPAPETVVHSKRSSHAPLTFS
jgi:hypothetical protein